MSTHRGAWLLRAGVVAAMAAGTLTAVATPAQADHDVQLSNIGNIDLRVGGGAQAVTLRVENRGGGPEDQNHNSAGGVATVAMTMTVPGDIGVHIQSAPNGCNRSANDTRMDCNNIQIPPGQAFSGVVQLAVHGNTPIQAGDSRNGTAQVSLTSPVSRNQQFNIRVNGPEQSPRAGEVSGVVTEQNTGDPVDGARVLLVDSEGQDFDTTTNAEGQFRFGGQEVAAGRIALSAGKDGFESGGESIHTVSAGQNLGDIRLAVIDTNTPPPTTAAASTPTAAPTATASPTPAPVPASSGGSFFTTLMIILGLLFVALGVGAIVLLIIRQRRRAQEDDDGEGPDGADDPNSGPLGPRPTPGSRGVYHPTPTQVAGAAAGQTQVLGPAGTALPAVGPRPALAETQTMMQQTMMQRGATGAADQTTMLPRAGDPPGPRPPVPGTPNVRPASPQATTYGSPATPYDASRSGYAGSPAAGYPGSPAAYGSPAAPASGGGSGYGNDRGYGAYDQPTGRHERPGYDRAAPERGAGYDRAAPERGGGYDSGRPTYRNESYGPDPYTQPRDDGYAGAGYEASGYDNGHGGYGGQGHAGRGYEGRRYDDGQAYGGQGYGEQSYEGGHSYDDRGEGYGSQRPSAGSGYGAAPEYGEPRTPAPQGYYDDAAPRSRHEAPPPPDDRERRRLDWLD